MTCLAVRRPPLPPFSITYPLSSGSLIPHACRRCRGILRIVFSNGVHVEVGKLSFRQYTGECGLLFFRSAGLDLNSVKMVVVNRPLLYTSDIIVNNF